MSGKELKAFAEKVPDEAVVSMRERNYGAYETNFQIQASIIFESKIQEESTDV